MKDTLKLAHRHRRAILICCVVIWLGALIATHIPVERLPRVKLSDVVLHAAGYFVLGAMFWLTLWAHDMWRTRRIWCVFLIMVSYAAMDELTQPLVNRVAAMNDWLADVIGMAAALVLCEALARRR